MLTATPTAKPTAEPTSWVVVSMPPAKPWSTASTPSIPATVQAGNAMPYPMPASNVPGRIEPAQEVSTARHRPSRARPQTNNAMPPRMTGLVSTLAIRLGPTQALERVKAIAIGSSPNPVWVAVKPRTSCMYNATTTNVGPSAVFASSDTRFAPPVMRRQKIGIGINGYSTLLSTQTNKASKPKARATSPKVIGDASPTCSLLANANTSVAAPQIGRA